MKREREKMNVARGSMRAIKSKFTKDTSHPVARARSRAYAKRSRYRAALCRAHARHFREIPYSIRVSSRRQRPVFANITRIVRNISRIDQLPLYATANSCSGKRHAFRGARHRDIVREILPRGYHVFSDVRRAFSSFRQRVRVSSSLESRREAFFCRG